jgi:hypothetical protein
MLLLALITSPMHEPAARALVAKPDLAGAASVRARCLGEELASQPLNSHTLHRVLAPLAANHCQELAFSSSHGNHWSHGAGHPRTSEECLISDRRLNLAEVC